MSFNGLLYISKRYLHFNSNWLKNNTLYRQNLEKDACGVGMIANLNNDHNRNLILSANEMLINMTHRGACGIDEKCGDGAGILTNIPHSFFSKHVNDLPGSGYYGTGNIFFGRDLGINQKIKDLFKNIIENEFGFNLLNWRKIPSNNSILGIQSLETEPIIEQIFITNGDGGIDNELFERQLLLLRNVITNRINNELSLSNDYFYICSLSNKTITYKGQLTPEQLFKYFIDLQDNEFISNFALVHSRFSTNTFPSWDRAQPNRISCHNGEINTLRGNKNWMHSRSGLAYSSYFNDKSYELFPICNDNMTDSGNFDSVLETLTKGGSNCILPEIVISMIPEAWQNDNNMSINKKLMYEYLSCKMEPWDGPALIAFCDGNYAGCVLDRNGLRPSRYYITNNNNIIVSSEIGVLPNIDQSIIIEKGRLEPGKIFLIDLNNNRIIRDKEFKDKISTSRPYKEWLNNNLITLNDILIEKKFEKTIFEIKNDKELAELNRRLNQFNFTTEGIELLLQPMFITGKESLGSMGNDASLACLSSKPKSPFEYFKQLFAQVTNPPIDPIRESFVMTLKCPVGPELNIFDINEGHCKRLTINSPILTFDELNVLKNISPADSKNRGWKSLTLDCTFKPYSGKERLIERINQLCIAAENAITRNNVPIIVLSDRNASDKQCPIPSLIIIGAIHHHLISKQLRSKVALFIESGDAKEVHDFCTLLGYGADGICPYMVYRTISKLHYENNIYMKNITKPQAIENYINAINRGILKVMSKMGISTLQSYKGAQVFEAIGLNDDIISLCFKGTESRIRGTNFDVLYTDIIRLHEYGYGVGTTLNQHLRTAGDYHYRIKQEEHFNTPGTITALQTAVRLKNQDAYNEYSEMSNTQSSKVTLRGLLKFNRDKVKSSIPIDQVEPAIDIMRRFNTGAMSLGSISQETHETLAQAMNKINGRSNTGEGGEDPKRFKNDKRSAIKQIASGRFGVTINYLTNADQIQIKMAQGAKPGEGGELPGEKVSDYIGLIRHTTPGVQLISPPPHHDIYSIEDLSQLIFDLKQCNPTCEVSVKLVSEIGVGIIAAGVTKAKANHITISGHDGGTGASAWTGVKHGGVPWELGIAEVQQTLVLNGLRDRVKIQTDGQLKTGRDVIIATLLGAEEYGFATAPLIALGCIMMRKCHLNTCPVGIATQDPQLRQKFEGQSDHVINFFYYLAEEIRGYMASLGFEKMNDMVGRTDYLKIDDAKLNYKSKHINLNPLLFNATKELNHHKLDTVYSTYCIPNCKNGLDDKLIQLTENAINDKKPINIKYDKPISNLNRTVGATLSNKIALKYGEDGLPDNTINIQFIGYGGQSFCCGLAKGITIQLEGDSNDYVGKLLSGGIIAIYPPNNVGFNKIDANKQTIVGNACLYGATSGKAFFNGKAGERFAVRNSGAISVIEGVGDHGCEYMTGGTVIILGLIGKNFAAGMSGGIAYIYNLNDNDKYINKEMIGLEYPQNDDIQFIQEIINQHYKYTKSEKAKEILNDWDKNKKLFTKIMPNDYKRVLLERQSNAMEI